MSLLRPAEAAHNHLWPMWALECPSFGKKKNHFWFLAEKEVTFSDQL